MHGLFHKFSGVIMPHQVRKMASEWIIHGVAMDGHVLTEIHAACYRTKSTHTESQSEFGVDNQDTALHPSPAEYFAVLVSNSVIQVCAADGTCQELEDSPYMLLDVGGQ
ncbi:hypothetical protein D5086_016027 [Populus alba]|uniref:Uncharacterized protein n=1 Tax=Populus alba TaxID=43335 RepID=A0ACC4BTG5_POPAL